MKQIFKVCQSILKNAVTEIISCCKAISETYFKIISNEQHSFQKIVTAC